MGPEVQPRIQEAEAFHDGYVFRLDYQPDTPDAVLQNDITTYLEEYRLQVQKSQYNLLYTKGDDGEFALRSSDNGDSMISIGRNAIRDRLSQGKPVAKESADLLGMERIQAYTAEAEEGDTLVWASPPDSSVGYEYGFLYVGHIEKISENEKRLKMSAVRLDNEPSLEQFNSALSLMTQEEVRHRSVNEFISSPKKIQRYISEQEVDFILKGSFDFKRDAREAEKTDVIKERLQPYIDVFKNFVRDGASQSVLRKMVFALENYTLALKEELETEEGKVVFYPPVMRLGSFVERYAVIPPKVVGSCDVGDLSSGPNVLGYSSIFSSSMGGLSFLGNEKDWSYTLGECVVCEDKLTQVGPCKICKTCEKKFD